MERVPISALQNASIDVSELHKIRGTSSKMFGQELVTTELHLSARPTFAKILNFKIRGTAFLNNIIKFANLEAQRL